MPEVPLSAGVQDGRADRKIPTGTAAVRLRDATLSFGTRTLWSGLDLDVAPGEFLAVLGPNGSGKTSLLRVLLGQQALDRGTAEIAGKPVRRGSTRIGYVPQQKAFDPGLPVRGRDLVGFGLDGHKWGLPLGGRTRRRTIDEALASVNASSYGDVPIGLLSGGEQQRLRIAQALITNPAVLLCDEPLLSLDIAHQRSVSELIDARRKASNAAVVFVTHEINPILDKVDRVLYLVDGQFRVGPPAEVMTSDVLTELYGTRIDVIHVGGRIVVVGAEDHGHHPTDVSHA